MKIIYIHGFNSGGSTNEKARLLADHFGNVIAPDLSPSPDEAMQMLVDEVIASDIDDLVLVGTSLGGFYAHHLSKTFGIKAVLINPSMDPSVTLASRIGHHTNYATGVEYDFTAADVAQLEKYYVPIDGLRVPTIVALDLGDELLDAAATAVMFKGFAKIITYEGGNHRFTHMAELIPEIERIEHVIYD